MLIKRASFIFLIWLAAVLSANAMFWNVEQAYSGEFGTGDTSLAVTASTAYVSFAANNGLFLATNDLTTDAWSTEYVATVGYFGGFSSLGLSGGQPCVAYMDGSSGTSTLLKYAYKSGGTWHVEQIEDVGSQPDRISLSFDTTGAPCIAYAKSVGSYPSTAYYMAFARRIGANSWTKTTVSQIGQAVGVSLVIDPTNTAYISYPNSTTGQLMIGTRPGTGTWALQSIAGTVPAPVIGSTSLALQPNGKPAVAYFLSSSGSVQLRFGTLTGSVWSSTTAETLSTGINFDCSLAITPKGMPLIAYTNPSDDTFMNAWKSGGTWLKETIDSAPWTGTSPVMKLNSAGDAFVSYFDDWNFNVKHASGLAPLSIQDAKALSDGTLVQLAGVCASNAGGELGTKIYTQEPDRTAGIQLNFTTSAPAYPRGTLLEIQGSLTTISGERAITDPVIDTDGPHAAPVPLFMTNRNLGGTDNQYVAGPPIRGQRGISGANGLNNIGLLVCTCGRVKSVGTDNFVIDDGSGILLKCYSPGMNRPGLNSYVIVRGISSCEPSGANLTRLLRVRSVTDITSY